MLSDEQTSKGWPVSLLNDEQMSNWVGVKHLPVKIFFWGGGQSEEMVLIFVEIIIQHVFC